MQHRLVGIIAEYNPFHNGHSHQLRYLRDRYSPEGVIVAMSGNYVQRGEPASFDKFVRAEAALRAGADLVFELPQMYAVAAAGDFAAAGIALLSQVGCDAIACGAEDPEFPGLAPMLDILEAEPEAFKNLLRDAAKGGMTYPAARARALDALLPGVGVLEYLCKPNNLLTLEYSLAARLYAPQLEILPLPRRAAGHNDSFSTDGFAPASYLRGLLKKGDKGSLREFYGLVPDFARPLYDVPDFMEWSDFDGVLYDRLISRDLPDAFIFNRIKNCLDDYRGAESFIDLVKSKNITYTAASRALLHILLGYEGNATSGRQGGFLPYIRLLAMKKEAQRLLSSPPAAGNIKILTSLPQEPSPMLAAHIKNDRLYEGIRALKSGTQLRNEYKRRFLVME